MSGVSAFGEPARDEKSKRYRDLFVVPPQVHVAAYVTGGLKNTYEKIKEKQSRITHQTGMYTDQHGYFDPQPNMPLLAGRYKFIEILGRGQSSVIIKASDSFRDSTVVSIKVLHTANFLIGSQEADIMLEINGVDPWIYVPIVRLLNVFSFDEHYCLTFEVLHPDPITGHFKSVGYVREQSVVPIRDVTIKLLSVLGYLNRINVIHADLKPDNILLQEEKSVSSLRVVDFGNAIRCVHEELSLYYSDYELQTLIYRAPEVLLGLSFGLAVDVWSLGCIIAELYSGQPLFLGRNKNEVLAKVTSILGPLPEEFAKGEYSTQFNKFIGSPWKKFEVMQRLSDALGKCWDWKFVDFLFGLLALSPNERSTPLTAISHPFLAPSLPYLYLLAPPNEGKEFYASTSNKNTYPYSPKMSSGSVCFRIGERKNAGRKLQSRLKTLLTALPEPCGNGTGKSEALRDDEEAKEADLVKEMENPNTAVVATPLPTEEKSFHTQSRSNCNNNNYNVIRNRNLIINSKKKARRSLQKRVLKRLLKRKMKLENSIKHSLVNGKRKLVTKASKSPLASEAELTNGKELSFEMVKKNALASGDSFELSLVTDEAAEIQSTEGFATNSPGLPNELLQFDESGRRNNVIESEEERIAES